MTARRGAVARDLLVALIGFSLVLSVTFIAGRLLVPAGRLPAIVASPPITSPDTVPGEPVDPRQSARVQLAQMEGHGAVVLFSGESGYALTNVELLSDATCFDCSPDDPRSIERDLGVDIHVRFSGGDAAITLRADFVEVGVPRTEGLVMAISGSGLAYNAGPGQCTVDLAHSEHYKYPGSIGFFLEIKSFGGEIECADLEELRGGPTASVFVVFGYQEER